MSRVPITEVFFQNSVPPTLRRRYEVFLYKRGTSEKAKVFTAETAGEERQQPLITNVEGRVSLDIGGVPWVEEGKYTFKDVEGAELIPINLPEGVSSGGGGGAVSSVNGQTGVVVLTAASVGADPEGAAAAAQAASQPLDSDLTAIAALTTTAYGREFLTLATEAAGRTKLGLGTAATQASTAFDTAGAAAAAQAASQPLDSDLTAIAALTTTPYGRNLLTAANLTAIIGSEAIESSMLKALAVTAAKLGAESVEEAKIKALAVSTGKIAANAVTAAKLGSEAVEAAAIKAGAVSEAKLAEGAVSAIKLASNAVTTAKIANEAVTEEKLASAVQTKLKGAIRIPATFSMPDGTEVKAERLGQFWQVVATGETKNLVEARFRLASGTKAKFSLQKNGTAITGYSGIEAKSTEVRTAGTSTAISNNDLIALVVESIEGTPKGLSVTLVFESTH